MFSFIGKIISSIVIATTAFFGGHASPPSAVVIPDATSSPEMVASTSVRHVTPVSSSRVAAPAPAVPPSQVKTESKLVETPVTFPVGSTLCNGTYYSACTSGQDLVCPASGAAYCQPNAASISAQEQQMQQQQANQLAAQEERLKPLISQFDSITSNISSACQGAVAGSPVASCEGAESSLLTVLQKEAAVGISTQDAAPQLAAIQKEYAYLQGEYYGIATEAIPLEFIQRRQSNVSTEMQILVGYESMFTGY